MKPRPAQRDLDVDGRPELALVDAERESIAELLAELLLEAVVAGDEAAR